MKYLKRMLSFLLILAMVSGMINPMNVEAKATPKISAESVELYVGQSKKISVKGVSAKKVKWTSGKRSVATVSSKGKITAKKAGTATIKAKVSGKTYQCKVTVKNPKINKKTLSLYVGQSSKLLVVGTSQKAKWTSSKKSVATVSSIGNVKAKKAGKATIKANIKGKVYQCKVTVKNPELNKKTLTIATDQKASITLYGSKIRKAQSSNTKVAKVAVINNQGIVTGIGKGTATLTITGYNNKNYKCVVTVLEKKDPVYNVNFITDSDYTVEGKVYKKGAALGELPTPNKLNHIFSGWYYDQAFEKRASETDVVTKDLVLYAKYEEMTPLVYEESASSCVEKDVTESFTISIISEEEMDLEEVKKSVSIENITNPGGEEPMVLSGEGKNFKLSFTESGYDPGASYKVVLSDDNLSFTDGPKSVREYDFTAYAEEVLNMKYAEDVHYLNSSDFSDITINGEPADHFSISLFTTGEDGKTEGKLEGTFSSEKKFKVGDTVILYDGVRPDERTTDTPADQCGDVAYVKITKADGNHYAFEQAEAEDVIFTPDMLPINVEIDKDRTDGNILTASKDDLVFTDDIYVNIGLDSQTTIDVGDFLVFYEGGFDTSNHSDVSYGEITGVTDSGEDYVIEYNTVDWDYVSAVMDVYASENVDVGEDLDQKMISKIEKSVEKQAIDSGFAEEAGSYLAELAMETDTFSEISEDMLLNDDTVTTEDGSIAASKNIQKMAAKGKVEVSKPKVDATLSKNLKQYEDVKGLRLVLKISTTITIHASNEADVKIDISGEFEQEISLDVGLKAKAEWKVWGIFPYISEYRVNAAVDLYEYTGINIQADVTTAEGESDDKSDDKFEGEDLAEQIKELLDNFESSEDEEEKESISNKLVEKYKGMLQNESDWVELYKIQIFSKEQYVVQELPIVAVEMEGNFVIQVNANVSLGMDFYYKNAKRYNYSIGVFSKTIENNVINLSEERYEFDFYVMGVLGIRAGVELQLAIGLFSTKLDSVGFSCEAGAYVKLWGYFWYNLRYTASEGRSQRYLGALYVQVGAYLEIDFIAQAFNEIFSKEVNIFEKEWPLWSVGGKENILDFKMEEEELPDVKLKYYIKETVLPDSVFEMNYLDLVEGDEASKIYNDAPAAGFFTIEMTNDKFEYDAETNIFRVNPDAKDTKLEGDMIITWIPAPLAFTSKPIRRTIHITWDNLRDGYVIVPNTKGGSYVPIILAKYKDAIQKPEDPTRLGYVFDGWYADDNLSQPYIFPETMSNQDTAIYAKWKEAEDTPYKVCYYLQNLESDEYTLDKTVEGCGTTNSVVKPVPETYEGFVTPQAQELKILADGSAVLNYYYDRQINQVTFSAGDVDGEDEVVSLKYGAKVTAPVFAALGYSFEGWDKEVAQTMGAENVTYTAQWKPVNTTYRVEYYVQNEEGKFRLRDTVKGEAVPQTTFTSDELRKDDVYENEQEQITFLNVTVNGIDIDQIPEKKAEVSADGKTVIKVNYARAYGDITFHSNNGEEDIVEQYYVGQRIEFPQITRPGYTFLGWYKDEACDEKTEDVELANPGSIYYAKWEENPSIVVKHYIMKTDGSYAEDPDRSQKIESVTGENIQVSDYVAEDILVPDGIAVDRLSEEILTVKPGENTIKIYYKRIQHSLYWDLDGGTATNEYSLAGDYYYGASIVAPKPVKHGFMYQWEEAPGATMPARDVSYRVIWEETDKTVIRFVTPDNVLIQEIRGYEGDPTETPEAPKIEGYEFTGWDQDIPTAYPAENMTITALYKAITYKIVYEKNGGEFAGDTVVKETYTVEDQGVVLPVPVRKGYIFEGWYVDEECNTQTITEITGGSTGDTTVYAKWTAGSYSIIFRGSDADNAYEEMPSLTLNYGSKGKLPANIYTKEGYQFAGWTTVEGGQRVQFKDEAEVENLTDENNATVTLYAIFAQFYHLTYDNLGDAQMPQDVITTFTVDSAPITLSVPKKDKTGYTFDGWYLSQDFEGSSKVDTITPNTMARDITVYAKWKANQYSITFDANLKDGNAEKTQLCTYDEDTTLEAFSQLSFSNPGYAFMGWSKTQDSGQIDYQDNQKVKNLVSEGNIQLYAVWKEITYAITYQYGSGATTSGNTGTYTINSPDIQLKAPDDIAEGYQFLGWYDEELDSYVKTIQHGTYGNRTFVAKWAHAGIFNVKYDRTEEGTSYYRIIRHIPDQAEVTSDVQNVYYRTENGTAIGGTAKEVNFLHIGGPDVYVTFHQTDGDGSYKEIKVEKENCETAYTPNGNAQYPAASMITGVDGVIPEKYYYVKISNVLSTQENCQGVIGEEARVKRVIPVDESRIVDMAQFGKEHSSSVDSIDYKITDDRYTTIYNNKMDGILSTFDSSIRAVDREYIEDTSQYYDYYIKATVRESYDGYQHVNFYTDGGGYLKYQFEIHPDKCDKNWQYDTKMPAVGFNQGQVKKFKLEGANRQNISEVGSGSESKVRISKSVNSFGLQFGASGSGSDDWHIKDITQYVTAIDAVTAKQVGIAPMAFGTYKAGDEITIAVVMNELIQDYTSQEDLTGALNELGIPAENSSIHTMNDSKGTNVIYIDAVLKDDFEVTVDFNDSIVSHQSLLSGEVTDMNGNTGLLQ